MKSTQNINPLTVSMSAVDVSVELGESFAQLAQDARIRTRSDAFIRFVREQGISDPWEAKQRFKESLGMTRVYRGLCLKEGSWAYRTIFEGGILYSKIAAQTRSLQASLVRESEIGYQRGILARLNQQGTSYDEGDFVFSVAKFPEPQILPAGEFFGDNKRAYLLHFDMPSFDLTGITIADVARLRGRDPYYFRYCGIWFNALDPDVEMFVLHKTHISNLTYQTFANRTEILAFCDPYRQRMEAEVEPRGP
jgi:hypothetical protein